MNDLALEVTALLGVATTELFPLLSHEDVFEMRHDLLSEDVLNNSLFYTRPGSVHLQGMALRYAPFIHQFWHSPEVLKIVRDLARVELMPALN